MTNKEIICSFLLTNAFVDSTIYCAVLGNILNKDNAINDAIACLVVSASMSVVAFLNKSDKKLIRN